MSESDFIISSNDLIMSELSEFTEIPSKGFNRLFKVKRYGQWFVLKTLREEYSEQSTYRQLLKKEFEIGIQFNHPNVIRYLSFEPTTPYGAGILMEYIDGETLSETISRGIDNNSRKKIADELLSGLNYLHHLQLIHRDLKPANILITRNGLNVKIIDFGLSDTDYYAIFKQPAGTVAYSSPEQLGRREGNSSIENVPIDCRADIYALGKILLKLFPKSIYKRIAKKCINTNPNKRYQNIDAIQKAIVRHKNQKTLCLYASVLIFITALLFTQMKITNDSHYKTMQKSLDSVDVLSAELQEFREIKNIQEHYTKIIHKELDRIYANYENLLDTNTTLTRTQLMIEHSKASPLGYVPLVDSLQATTSNQEGKNIQDHYTKIIHKELDRIYANYENLLDTNTYLTQEELALEYSIASPLGHIPLMDSLKTTTNEQEIKNFIMFTSAQYFREKFQKTEELRTRFPSIYELEKQGDITKEELRNRMGKYSKRLKEQTDKAYASKYKKSVNF